MYKTILGCTDAPGAEATTQKAQRRSGVYGGKNSLYDAQSPGAWRTADGDGNQDGARTTWHRSGWCAGAPSGSSGKRRASSVVVTTIVAPPAHGSYQSMRSAQTIKTAPGRTHGRSSSAALVYGRYRAPRPGRSNPVQDGCRVRCPGCAMEGVNVIAVAAGTMTDVAGSPARAADECFEK